MRIAILSSFYPLRGGIAQFSANLLAALSEEGHTVKAFSFSRQYPGILFPGKTQYVTPEDTEAVPVESEALLDTANPFSWGKTSRRIRAWKPDILLTRYWMSWFAPSVGWVQRHVGCPVVAILDNVIPHEPHFFDKPLTKWFLRGADGFVTMAGSVNEDLLSLRPDAESIILPHPIYSHFGSPVPRDEAEKILGLRPGMKNLLFFGLIREYKGLDILLEAFRDLPDDYQLIVAGEPYGSFEPYQRIIDTLPGKDRVHLFPEYIPDSGVRKYFSAADVTVLPYRTATQSGISAISYHFDVPMIVTDTGGLRETVGDRGTGLVAPKATPSAVREEILRFFSDPSVREGCRKSILREKDRLSWERFARGVAEFANKYIEYEN